MSSIYRFGVTRVSNGVTSQTDHADLAAAATFRIGYAPARIPSGMSEANLRPYCYDSIWGRWVPVANGVVDTASHSVLFSSNHFSDYCVQADNSTEVSADQLRDSGSSPFATAIGQAPVAVSPTSGGVSTSFTESILPGVNHFDLVLSRSYDSSTAQADTPSSTPQGGSSGSTSQATTPNISEKSDGSYPWYLGQGWRLDFPYMKWSGSELWVRDLDGGMISLGQMKTLSSSLSSDKKTLTVTLENREGSPATLILSFTSRPNYFLFWQTGTATTTGFASAQLFMKDGREADFDSQGRVTAMYDSPHANSITFAYASGSTTIKQNLPQSKARTVTVAYESGSPRIHSLTVSAGTGASLTTNYTYSDSGSKLVTATDVGGRCWSYGYADKVITTTTIATTKGYSAPPPSSSTVPMLSSVSGPGIGYTAVDYGPYSNAYTASYTYDGSSTTYQIQFDRLYASALHVSADSSQQAQRTTRYTYKIAAAPNAESAGGSQFYTSLSTIDDGRVTRTTTYTPAKLTRTRLSQAPEAIRLILFPSETGDWSNQDSVVAISPQSSLTASQGGGEILETQNQTWDEKTLRVTKAENTRGEANKSTTSYSYDDWGNILSQVETTTVGSRSTTRSSTMAYYNANGSPIPDIPSGSDLPSSLNMLLFHYEHDRLAAKWTRIQGSDSANSRVSAEDVSEYDVYRYYSDIPLPGQTISHNGLVSKSQSWTGSDWATTSYTYNDSGQLSSATGPRGQVTAYTYDYGSKAGEYSVTTTQKDVAQADGSTRNIASSAGFDLLQGTTTWSADANGNTTIRSYDKLGRVTNIVEPPVNQKNPTTTISYDDVNLKATVTTPLGASIEYNFDKLGRLITTRKTNHSAFPLASARWTGLETIATSYAYDAYDQVLTVTGPAAQGETAPVTSYSYESRGRMASVKAPGAQSPRSYSYDDKTNTRVVTDEIGKTKTQQYDWSGRILSETQTVSGKTYTASTYYDGAGRIIASIDRNGNLSTIAYNTLGLKSKIVGQPRAVTTDGGSTEPVSPTLEISYNADGSVGNTIQTLESGRTRTTSYTTNGIGQTLRASTALTVDGAPTALIVKYGYDADGNLLTQTSGYSSDFSANPATTKTSSWTYDSHSRVLTRTIGKETTTYGYDAAGDRTSVTDPRQGKTTANGGSYTASFVLELQYDQLGRLIEADLPHSASNPGSKPTIQFAYDARGNLIQRQDADGGTTKYEYSQRNLLLASTLTDKNGSATYRTTYSYDDTGRPTLVTRPSGSTDELAYDEAGHLTWEGNGTIGYTRYSYDGNGNITSKTDGLGHSTTYGYNEDNLVTSVQDAKGNTSTANYDRWGQKLSSADANGNTRSYSYDQLGRLIAETTPWNARLQYSYDAWGNVTSQTDARGTTFTRSFNAENHLIAETARSADGSQNQTTTYSYDEAGDLINSNNGVLTSYNLSGGSYQADPYGMTTGKTTTLPGATIPMTFDYDERQRIREQTYPDATSISYAYNQLDQLTTIVDGKGGLVGKLDYDAYGRPRSIGLGKGKLATEATVADAYAYQGRLVEHRTRAGEQFSPRSVLSYLAAANAFCDWLARSDAIIDNPFASIRRVRSPETIPRGVLSEHEMEKLLDELGRWHEAKNLNEKRRRYLVHVVAELEYASGLRIAEVAALTPEDIDLERELVYVHDGKKGSNRVGFLTEYAGDILRLYLDSARPLLEGPTHRGHKLFFLDFDRLGHVVNAELAAACDRAGVAHITSHGFRHALGYHLLRSGTNLRHIQAILGHKMLKDTEIYTKIDVEDIKAVFDACHPRMHP